MQAGTKSGAAVYYSQIDDTNRCNCCIIKETSLCQILEVLAERCGQLELADFIFLNHLFLNILRPKKRNTYKRKWRLARQQVPRG